MAAPPPLDLQGLRQPPPPPPQQLQHHPYPAATPQGAPPAAPGLVTLLVRHLPEAMPQQVLARLFSYYRASSVRPCAAGRMRNCAFVDFADETLASQAQSQLNRMRFLGKVLTVERAGKAVPDNKHRQNESQPGKESSSQPAMSLNHQSVTGKPAETTDVNSVLSGEPIASRLGVDYPFPPYLGYEYPPPDGNILTNVVNALIAVPRFYTQVLHLMNKMNIPAPFRLALPTPPLPPTAPPPPPPPPPTSAKPHLAYISSDESELESSEEDVTDAVHSRKRVKRGVIVGPAVDRGVTHEDVGLKPASLVPKEVPMIKKKNPVLQIKIAPKPTPNECIDDDSSLQKTPASAREHLEPKPYITADEIEREKLPPEELLSLPMFKNYTPGNPATVLYVKNLAKDVIVDDFYFIFGSVFGSVEETKLGLGVKLMQRQKIHFCVSLISMEKKMFGIQNNRIVDKDIN
uniref:RNA-binding protein 40 n=1 Tax=Anthurium amnicola TaxID=1678845 RepID=A0A1D1XIR6_9ARAE